MSDPASSAAPFSTTASTEVVAVKKSAAERSHDDSRTPMKAVLDSPLININMAIAPELGLPVTDAPKTAIQIAQHISVSNVPRSAVSDGSLHGSLESLRLTERHAPSNAGSLVPSERNDFHSSEGNHLTQDSTKLRSIPGGSPTISSLSMQLLPRNSTNSSAPGQEVLPLVVNTRNPQAQQEFADQFEKVLGNPIDRPDPRLIDALEHPRDRLFVIKLERDLIAFVEEKTCEIFDLPQMNAFHRLLAHKIAEYYRLTHVADAQGSTVKMYRGQAARVPPTRLCSWPVSYPVKESSNGIAPAVKIMRREPSQKGTNTPRGSSTPSKDGSETSENESSKGPTTREEREAAYQQARARIFKDFEESPPDTPPPSKNLEKPKRRQEEPDDFSGRSQFYPVAQPSPFMATEYHSQAQYQEAQLQYSYSRGYNPVGHQMPGYQMPLVLNGGTLRFNPASASFAPSSGFTPSTSTSPYVNPQLTRQQFISPSIESVNDRNYSPSFANSQQASQPLYPQHPQPRSFLPGLSIPQPAVPGYHGMAVQQLPPSYNNLNGAPANSHLHGISSSLKFPPTHSPQSGLHNQSHGAGPMSMQLPSPNLRQASFPVPGSWNSQQQRTNGFPGTGWNSTVLGGAPKTAGVSPGFELQPGGAAWTSPYQAQKGAGGFLPTQWAGGGIGRGVGGVGSMRM